MQNAETPPSDSPPPKVERIRFLVEQPHKKSYIYEFPEFPSWSQLSEAALEVVRLLVPSRPGGSLFLSVFSGDGYHFRIGNQTDWTRVVELERFKHQSLFQIVLELLEKPTPVQQFVGSTINAFKQEPVNVQFGQGYAHVFPNQRPPPPDHYPTFVIQPPRNNPPTNGPFSWGFDGRTGSWEPRWFYSKLAASNTCSNKLESLNILFLWYLCTSS